MTSIPTTSLIILIVLLSPCWHAGAEDEDVVAVFGDEELASGLGQLAIQPASLEPVKKSDLPALRPPYHTKQGWSFCNYTCAEYVRVKDGALRATPGVMELDVKIKPVRGVTSTMMQWLWRSLPGKAKYWVDNTTYPMYQIMHPVDHVVQTSSPMPVKLGSNFSFIEYTAAGCKYNRNSADTPITCPSMRTGFLRSSPPAEWKGAFQLKETMQVSRFTRKMFEFTRKQDVLQAQPRTVAATRISWEDTDDGVTIRVQDWIGLMQLNTTTSLENSNVSVALNPIIKNVFLGGATNVENANISQVAWMFAMHRIEEFDGLKLWLPALWRSRVKL